jgi:hypothetical protein
MSVTRLLPSNRDTVDAEHPMRTPRSACRHPRCRRPNRIRPPGSRCSTRSRASREDQIPDSAVSIGPSRAVLGMDGVHNIGMRIAFASSVCTICSSHAAV